jgi:hypothetical protein
MLYDNAQLARVYLHAWQVTGNELFRTVTEEILDYVVREMLDESGGFYSTQDADSEGEKGKCFFWTPDEIRALLRSEADAFMAAYGVTRHGNASTGSAHGFEGKNILEFVGGMEQCPALTEAYRKLFEAREKRVHPGRDEQVLASWNGLMPAAVGEAASTLNREGYGSKGEGGHGWNCRGQGLRRCPAGAPAGHLHLNSKRVGCTAQRHPLPEAARSPRQGQPGRTIGRAVKTSGRTSPRYGPCRMTRGR